MEKQINIYIFNNKLRGGSDGSNGTVTANRPTETETVTPDR